MATKKTTGKAIRKAKTGVVHDRKVPNATTRKALGEADAGKVNRYADADAMFKKMGI